MAEQPSSVTDAPQIRRHRLHEIDLLRFIAAIMVVLLHYSRAYEHGDSEVDLTSIGPITKYGYLGVDLFFIISGMVVFMSLWGRSASDFLISRAARLYPAYWVAATLTTLTVLTVGARGRDGISLVQYLVNLTMFPAPVNVTYVEAVYWTLWSEWRFYALLFVLALIGLTARVAHRFMWGWLAITVALEPLPLPAATEHLLGLVVQPVYSHYFIAGMALYFVYRSGWTTSLALLLLGSYAHAVYQGVRHAGQRNQLDAANVDPTVVAVVITTIFLVMTLVATGALARWSGPALLPLGEMTYPLYLIHATLGYAIFDLLAPAVNRWALLVGVTTAMCALSWAISRLIEARLQPVLRGTLRRAWHSARASTGAQVGRG